MAFMHLQRSLQLTLILLPVTALVLYWWWDFANLQRWFGESQVQWFGNYSETVSFLLSLLVPLLVVGLPVVLGLRQRRVPPAALSFGLALVGCGVITAVPGVSTRQRWEVDIADLEAGQPLPGRWLELKGRPLPEQRIIWNAGQTRATYVPFVSGDWQPGNPVAVFVRASEENWGDPGMLIHYTAATVAGVADLRGLPAGLARLFAEEHALQLGEPAIVLDWDIEPVPQFGAGMVVFFAGLILVIFSGAAWFVVSFREVPALTQPTGQQSPSGEAS
jgi:hypothetical protein